MRRLSYLASGDLAYRRARTSIRLPQLKRAVSVYKARAKMLGE